MILDDLYTRALSFYGIPYQWGGKGATYDGPTSGKGGYGYDCSGLVQAILAGTPADVGEIENSQALYSHFSVNNSGNDPGLGALAFFGTSSALIQHVGFMLDHRIMISAAGGGPLVTTIEIARRREAYVKIQPISWWRVPSCVAILVPRYA